VQGARRKEKAFLAQRDRPELKAALAYMRKGDTFGGLENCPACPLHETAHRDDPIVQERGIGLKSLQDPIDTSSLSGKLVFHIFAALAQLERGVIRERTTPA
jgi:DNA invertase Pin-like site-specific DNA recombinase